MSLIPQPEQPTPTIRSVKLPRHRLRSYGSCLKSVHRPGAHLTLPSDPITVVCISDTHGTKPPLPPGDILLHAGDLSVWGTCAEIQEQLTWLATQPHRYKVVIAGNHDLLLDDRFQDKHPKKWRQIMKVARLSICLDVDVSAHYYSRPDDPHEERDFKMMGAANERAADILMDSGIF